LEKLRAYKRRLGWSFPSASSYGSDYNFDLEISLPREITRELQAGFSTAEKLSPEVVAFEEDLRARLGERAKPPPADPRGSLPHGLSLENPGGPDRRRVG
jgi:predicted dithiol-disulfide oxidoreductase (DUF899 family)